MSDNRVESADGRRALRVLYISGTAKTDFLGGIETYGRGLIDGIRARGHAVELLDSGPDVVYGRSKLFDYWPSDPFRQKYYFWKRAPHEDYRYHVALRRQTREQVRSFRPDVIHSLHPYRLGAVLATSLPVVVSTYGLEVTPAPPVLGSLGRANVVHAISNFTADLVKATCPAVPPIRVIRWGVAGNGIPRTLPPEYDLITVSRLVRRKNVDTVLRAIAQLGDLRYAVVGDGPELSALRDLAASLGLKHVRFFGSVSDAERQRLLVQSRLFVMCPRAEPGDVEGLGLVYYEALGAGLPIVAGDNGGVPEAVGRAGILVRSPESPAEIADAIRLALRDDTYVQLRSQVAERQLNETWDGFLATFEHLYQELRNGVSTT